MAQPRKAELTVVRQSPAVIIKNLIVLEFAGAVAYLVTGLFANYGELYQTFTLSGVLSYEIAKFLLIVAGEALLIGFIFVKWFMTTYGFTRGLAAVEKGIILKQRISHAITPDTTVSFHYGPLGKLFKYGTLMVHDKQGVRLLMMPHLPTPDLYRKILYGGAHAAAERSEAQKGIHELLREREHEKLEFKASLRWNEHEGKPHRNMEKAALKTVAAFLNTDGGELVIGVADHGTVQGLQKDYETLSRRDADGFENHFTNIFNEAIGAEFRRYVKLAFHRVSDREVCVIHVSPATEPAYMKFNDEEAFYIRTGNSTTALPLRELTPYIDARFRED